MASNRGLGSLTLDLILKIGGFVAGMDKAARITDKRMKEIEARAVKFGKILGKSIAGAAIAAVTGVIAITKQAIDAADRINDISKRLGVSTEALSAWGYAAQQSGTDLEALNIGLTRFTRNVAAALDSGSRQGEIFAALGISVKDAAGNLRSVEDLVPEVAEAFKDLNNATLESALAQELFGKSGTQLLQFLNLGSSGLDEMAQKAAELGIVISKDTAEAADEFNDQLNDLKTLVGGLGTQIASELLPDLIELVAQFKEIVKEGSLVDNIVSAVRFTFDDLSTSFSQINALIKDTINFFGGLKDSASATLGAIKGIITLDFGKVGRSVQESAEAAKRTFSRSEQRARGTGTNFPLLDILKVPALNPDAPFSIIPATPLAQGNRSSEARLNEVLANRDKAKTKKAKKEGKSDAEKEAERLLQAYERMSASLKEQAALQGEVSEVEKLRYELANGELAKLNDAQKQSLLTDAAALDQAREAYKLQQDGKALIESLLTPTEQINELRAEAAKLLEAGAIAQADYNKAIASYMTPAEEVIAGLKEEIMLIGMSDLAQQKYIATKQLGADATAKEIADTERLIEVRQRAKEAAQLQAEVEYGLADAIYDVASGAKSAGDAIKDFFDDLAKYILRMITENWAKQIAGLFTNTGGGGNAGTGTNWFAALAGALLGGGKASGGTAWPNSMYQVNERGFEMATVGGNDYMLTGSQPVKITPNHQLQGGGLVQNIQFNVQGRVSDETRSQAAAKVAYATQLVTARNGR